MSVESLQEDSSVHQDNTNVVSTNMLPVYLFWVSLKELLSRCKDGGIQAGL
jgi:hypothetical protein